jgi:hypothetical protein
MAILDSIHAREQSQRYIEVLQNIMKNEELRERIAIFWA